MRNVFQLISWAIGLLLQLLVVSALVRGAYRKFPFVFVYCLTLLLATITEVAAFTASALAKSLYWVNEVILQTLIFCVVISLIYQAMEQAQNRVAVRRWLMIGAAAIMAIAFLIHRNPAAPVGRWMTDVSRDLSFASVILDLVLWSILIASSRRDLRLLLLSGALGIQFTGAAIGQSLRQLAINSHSETLVFIGNLCVVGGHSICLYVWWQTFRQPEGMMGVKDPKKMHGQAVR